MEIIIIRVHLNIDFKRAKKYIWYILGLIHIVCTMYTVKHKTEEPIPLFLHCKLSGSRRWGRTTTPTELKCPDPDFYYSLTHDEVIENVASWQECGG